MAFVTSEGTLKSLSKLELPSSSMLKLTDSVSMEYYELWKKQSAVRTAVSFIARNIAHLGLHVFERRGDDDRQRLTDHPLALLLSRPSAATTRYRLMDALVHDLLIYDMAYWGKAVNDDGTPSLTRIPPAFVTPKGESWIAPEFFEVKGSRGKVNVPAEEIVFFRGYSNTGIAGESPIESLRNTLSEEYEASTMREQMLKNGARVSGYLERPPSTTTWSQEAKEKFAKGWRSQYAGGGPQSGGTPILEDGMKFVPASQTAKDLQYIEARKLTREEVAAAYFIPPTMLGLMGGATYSNITEQHKMLYQDTLGPWLQMIKEEIELQLVPDLADSNVYVEFNLREKLTGSFEERQAAITGAVGGPTMTINEARALDNRTPLDGGDVLIRPLNVTQDGDPKPIPAEPAGTNPEEVVQ